VGPQTQEETMKKTHLERHPKFCGGRTTKRIVATYGHAIESQPLDPSGKGRRRHLKGKEAFKGPGGQLSESRGEKRQQGGQRGKGGNTSKNPK